MIKKLSLVAAMMALTGLAAPALASADVITDWNRTMVQTLEIDKTPPPPSARVAAIVQSSVFDAVNGIARRYTPVHVPPVGPRDASQAAAAAGAAHETLAQLFPAPGQQALLDQQLADTVAQLSTSDDSRSIAEGLAWGKTVADQILAWRASDGFSMAPGPYTPSGLIGQWAPTPPLFQTSPLFMQFATMTPFAIASPAQFLPGPPPSLTSARYARDFNEVEILGSASSTLRTPEQGQTATFWQSDTPAAIWNRVADDLDQQGSRSLLHSARVLALMNLALADTTIAIWNAKNTYDRWRPVTAIAEATLDGNPFTTPVADWTPLLATPPFQEYPAAHPGVSNAAASVLASFYGECTSFTVTSAAPSMTGVVRSFTSFPAAVEQVQDARVWGGIHFRFSTQTGARMGAEVAHNVTWTHLLPIHSR
jgi:PAP2 superfamily